MPRAENDSPDVPLHVGGMAPGLQGHDFIDLFGDIEQAGFVFQDQSNGADRLRVTAVIARNAKGAQRFPDDRVHGEHLLEICDEKIVRRKTAKPEKTTSLRKFDIFHCVGKLHGLSSRIWNPLSIYHNIFFYFCLESGCILQKNERRKTGTHGEEGKVI